MTEYYIPHSEQIARFRIGKNVQDIPEEGLTLDTKNFTNEPWVITLQDGRQITVEQAPYTIGEEYIFVPWKKNITFPGFTRLLSTERGSKGAKEFAIGAPGFRFDGSSPRASVMVNGEDVLVYLGRSPRPKFNEEESANSSIDQSRDQSSMSQILEINTLDEFAEYCRQSGFTVNEPDDKACYKCGNPKTITVWIPQDEVLNRLDENGVLISEPMRLLFQYCAEGHETLVN